ncbi:hypothetical protein EVAR_18182_1 [Eumeta japonica]|uniref:Uncharacterized protein n=1 Tax=Eumeta variegata TaxID=151549 RepID=A0A4C1UV52_EUMVA|nr:hypothetical protein EVAR_18182_1 [Eumeta japonica]
MFTDLCRRHPTTMVHAQTPAGGRALSAKLNCVEIFTSTGRRVASCASLTYPSAFTSRPRASRRAHPPFYRFAVSLFRYAGKPLLPFSSAGGGQGESVVINYAREYVAKRQYTGNNERPRGRRAAIAARVECVLTRECLSAVTPYRGAAPAARPDKTIERLEKKTRATNFNFKRMQENDFVVRPLNRIKRAARLRRRRGRPAEL